MPSIFNHDNACWGIRRTSYNIFNEPTNFELNSQKLNTSPTDCHPEIKVENYHGSSNGYYGYHIPAHVNISDSCAMDTNEDISDIISITENNNHGHMETCNLNNNCRNDFGRRKRSHPNDTNDSYKKSKKTEPEVVAIQPEPDECSDVNSTENDSSLPTYSFYRCTWNELVCNEDLRVVHKETPHLREEDSLEFFESYLKQTHGCDFYNYIKSDGDYDL